MKKMFMSIMVSMVALCSSFGQNLTWQLKATQTIWRESQFTGTKFDEKVKDVKVSVKIKISKVKIDGNYSIKFERVQMHSESDDDYEPLLTTIDYEYKNALIDALKDINKRWSLPSTLREDCDETIFDEDGLCIKFIVENHKARVEIDCESGSSFILTQNHVSQFLSKVKML